MVCEPKLYICIIYLISYIFFFSCYKIFFMYYLNFLLYHVLYSIGWLFFFITLINDKQISFTCRLPLKEKFRISCNREKGVYQESLFINFTGRYVYCSIETTVWYLSVLSFIEMFCIRRNVLEQTEKHTRAILIKSIFSLIKYILVPMLTSMYLNLRVTCI